MNHDDPNAVITDRLQVLALLSGLRDSLIDTGAEHSDIQVAESKLDDALGKLYSELTAYWMQGYRLAPALPRRGSAGLMLLPDISATGIAL